jgi:hypothetical protein
MIALVLYAVVYAAAECAFRLLLQSPVLKRRGTFAFVGVREHYEALN